MLLLGFYSLGLGWSYAAITPWLAVLIFPWISEKNWLALVGILSLGVLCFFYVSFNNPSGPEKEIRGTGYFRILEIKDEESPFGKTISYQGKLLQIGRAHV